MLFFRLGDLPLMEPDEGRNAEVSREMLNAGSWLVPTLDGLPYLDKPAFFFRSAAISMSLFGPNETAARLPAALCGVAILAMLFGFCRRHYGEPAASLAVLVAATAPFFFAFSRLVIMDTMVGLFICASIFSACVAEEAGGRTRRLWYLASAAAAGCGTIVKGPVGFLIPALVVLVFNRFDGRRGAIRRCFAPLNIVFFFAVVLPWFVALCLRHSDFFYYGLVEESLRRFIIGGGFRHAEPFYYYLPVVIAGLFPWSLLLPESILFAWKRRARWTSADRLFVAWTLVTITFFSVSRAKQPAYVLPAFVALAALLGRLIAHALNHRDSHASRLILRSAIALALVYALLAAAAGLVSSGSYFPGGEAVSTTAVVAARLAAAVSGVLLAAIAAITAVALVAFWRRSVLLAAISFALFSICLVTAGFPQLETYARIRSARDLADALADLPEGTEIACFHCFPASLAFYQRRLLPVFDTGGTPEQLRSNYLLFLWRRGALQSNMVFEVNRLNEWIATRRGPVFVVANPTGRHWLGTMAATRGLPVRNVAFEWWGFLIPARGGD
jgi:4-amino-4-deoxy-L-arabinose transferase-like glycosyltransferase